MIDDSFCLFVWTIDLYLRNSRKFRNVRITTTDSAKQKLYLEPESQGRAMLHFGQEPGRSSHL